MNYQMCRMWPPSIATGTGFHHRMPSCMGRFCPSKRHIHREPGRAGRHDDALGNPDGAALQPASRSGVGLSYRSPDEERAPMVCPYCKHDVDNPCHTIQEVQQRASDQVERCERALNRQKDASQGGSGGSI